jgi:hypothetical protein
VAVSSRYMFITEGDTNRVTVLNLDDDMNAVTAVAAPSPCGVAVCLNESVVALTSCSEHLRFVDIRAAAPVDWRRELSTAMSKRRAGPSFWLIWWRVRAGSSPWALPMLSEFARAYDRRHGKADHFCLCLCHHCTDCVFLRWRCRFLRRRVPLSSSARPSLT